jgi:hypothetical protein
MTAMIKIWLLIFWLELCLASPIAHSPNRWTYSANLHFRDVSQNKSSGGWSKGKQAGVIVAGVIGGGIILFLWGWILKGRKMWQGSKLLWLKSHIGSQESKEEAKQQHIANKQKLKEERDKFWGQPARTKPTRTQMAAAATAEGERDTDAGQNMKETVV